MKLSTIPGFGELFGEAKQTYEELMKGIPTSRSLQIIIGINAETYANLPPAENQGRIWHLWLNSLPSHQATLLNDAWLNYKRFNPEYEGYLFSSRYLVEMAIREFNRSSKKTNESANLGNELNILLAYFLVVQDVNKEDEVMFNLINSASGDENFDFRVMWPALIKHYEFTDDPHPAYNVYKLLQFCLFVVEHYPKRMKEYLARFKFKRPIEFIGSFVVLAQAAIMEDPEKLFRNVTFIKADENSDAHLVEMDIHEKMKSNHKLTLEDIKTNPLFKTSEKDYLIIDRRLFLKKVYIGPFFELIKKTDLAKDLGKDDQAGFNAYSTTISEAVLEKRCFVEILSRMRKNRHDVLYLDDGTKSCPDGYYRFNRTIFLIEFKGYVFPTKLTENPDFDEIKRYLDERFIEAPGGKAKGIGQLARQIGLLHGASFNFDRRFIEEIRKRTYTIYPVVCHTDYYFSMPGVSDYLNREFRKRLPVLGKARVKDLVVIDLSHLFEMMSYGKTFADLQTYFDDYYIRLKNWKKVQERSPSTSNFLASYAGFDDLYRVNLAQVIRRGQIVKKYLNELIKKNEQALSNPISD